MLARNRMSKLCASTRRCASVGAALMLATLLGCGNFGTVGPPGPEGPAGPQGPPGEPGAGLVPEEPMTEVQLAAFEADNAECLACHAATDPRMIEDYKLSAKARAGIQCVACHAENPEVAVGNEGHRFLPTPETCAACHPHQYAGHRANRHSVAYIRMLECGRYDDFPQEFQTGSGYHFSSEDVAQLGELMNTAGQTLPADHSVMSVQMCGQCHNVENRCDSCHFRHRFSPEEARDPMACATCHMGPDHPQIEMYQHSKHGARFEVYGDTETVPVCVDCHMPFNAQMLGKKTADDGTEYTDHDLSRGIAYGPVGGGTTHKGHTMDPDTGRVKFTARDGDATYAELWLDRDDGKVYDAGTGGAVVFANLLELGLADAGGNGKQDYVVAQVADSAAMLAENREFMQTRVCGQCHSDNFAHEQLLIADLIHENTRSTLMEAFDVLKALALTGKFYLPAADRPANPETGTVGTYGANMKIRNLNAVEKMYFTMMKYDNVKTWKGAYHQNPDYTHWYGWSALVMSLGEIGDEATDNVLQHLWIGGVPYTGATGNVLLDGLYQGVIYATASMTNLYDKYPGPDDPAAGDAIDVDMDGTPEFIPVDGSPGTFTFDGTEVTFH